MTMRTIDADNLSSRKFAAIEDVSYEHPRGWYEKGWNDAIDAIMENEPSVPSELAQHLAFICGQESVKSQIGTCKTCSHRDPEDKKCDCGRLERVGCSFPVHDNYYCKYYERRTWEVDNEQ